jgi:hypothetical protein
MNYNKKLEVDCDDEMFASGKILLEWKSEDQLKETPLRTCKLSFDLQFGSVAVLRFEEVDELISKLELVKERLRP